MTPSEGLLERDLQAKCVAWWNCCEFPGLLFHVPNEGKRSRLEAAALASIGVVAGAPDLVLLLPGFVTLLVELKTPTGELSSAQRAFQSECDELSHDYVVCRSLTDFQAVVADAIGTYSGPLF